MLRHVLVELGKYTHSGTLIYWPWGSLRNRDDLGRIRIFPWIAGIPVDGPEARKLSCVRSVQFNCSKQQFAVVVLGWAVLTQTAFGGGRHLSALCGR